LAEKERVANRTEEEVENEKVKLLARCKRLSGRKDRDGKLADEVDNLVEGRRAGFGSVRMASALSLTANYGQWNGRSGD
jgi:hypothetical protein